MRSSSVAERGGLSRPLHGLLANMPLRGCIGRTGFSSSTTLVEKSKMGPQGPHFEFLAERAGFEPAVRYKRTLAFQASALSHSATSPHFFQIPHNTTGGIDSNRSKAILTLKGAFGVQNANAFCDSSLRSSPLQGALRASKSAPPISRTPGTV